MGGSLVISDRGHRHHWFNSAAVTSFGDLSLRSHDVVGDLSPFGTNWIASVFDYLSNPCEGTDLADLRQAADTGDNYWCRLWVTRYVPPIGTFDGVRASTGWLRAKLTMRSPLGLHTIHADLFTVMSGHKVGNTEILFRSRQSEYMVTFPTRFKQGESNEAEACHVLHKTGDGVME